MAVAGFYAVATNEFAELTTVNKLEDVLACPANDCDYSEAGHFGIFRSWSGAAYDPIRGWYIKRNGGHGAYGGDEPYRFKRKTLTWDMMYAPSSYTGGFVNDTYLSTGRPVPYHSYQWLQAHDGRLYLGSAVPDPDSTSVGGAIWDQDLDVDGAPDGSAFTRTDFATGAPGGSGGGSVLADGGYWAWYSGSSRIYRYDLDAQTVQEWNTFNSFKTHQTGVYVENRRVMVLVDARSSTRKIRVVDIDNPGSSHERTEANGGVRSGDMALFEQHTGMAYVADDVVYCLVGSTDNAAVGNDRFRILRINIPSDPINGQYTVDQMTYTGTAPADTPGLPNPGDRGQAIYNSWQYLPEEGCCMVVLGADQYPHIYRPAEAQATAPTPPPEAVAGSALPTEHMDSPLFFKDAAGAAGQGPRAGCELIWGNSTGDVADWVDANGAAQGAVPLATWTGITTGDEGSYLASLSVWHTLKGFTLKQAGDAIIDVHGALSAQPPELVVNGVSYPAYLSTWVSDDTNTRETDVEMKLRNDTVGLVRFDAPEGPATLRIAIADRFSGTLGAIDVLRNAYAPSRDTWRPDFGAQPAGLRAAAGAGLLVHSTMEEDAWVTDWHSANGPPFTSFATDFDQSRFALVNTAENGFVPSDGNALRVLTESHGTDDTKTGISIYWWPETMAPGEDHPTSMNFAYNMWLANDWQPPKGLPGGKFPAFRGKDFDNVADQTGNGGAPASGSNWSCRMDFRGVESVEGGAELVTPVGWYMYHMDQIGTFGDVIAFLDGDTFLQLLRRGEGYTIECRCVIGPNGQNCEVQAWINGVEVSHITGIHFTDWAQTLSHLTAWCAIVSGGSGADPNDKTAFLDNMIVRKDVPANTYIGPDPTLSGQVVNAPPSVTIGAPISDAVVSGTSVSFTADAVDTDGTVTQVEFRAGGQVIGAADTTAPYSVVWDTTLEDEGDIVIEVFATDDQGSVGTASHTVTVDNVADDTTDPTVTLDAPLAGLVAGNAVALSASAADDVAVAHVTFDVDGTVIGSPVTAAPYSASWDTTSGYPDGSYTVRALVTDTSGNTAEDTVTVTVDNTAPAVAITSHADGDFVRQTVSLTATATDANAIQDVELRAGGVTLATDSTDPFSAEWITTAESEGPIAIEVIGTDQAGNVTTVGISLTVDNTAPVPLISAPIDGETVGGASVQLSATATDANGVQYVRFVLDGATLIEEVSAPPYNATWNASALPNGQHVISATAADLAGNTALDSVTVTVDNTTPDTTDPTVSITSPSDGDPVGGTIDIEVMASDDVGVTIVRVEVDGSEVDTDPTEPYQVSWSTATVADGTRTITVFAEDAAGNEGTASIDVQVDNTAPAVTLDAPADGATVTIGDAVPLGVTATDANGSVGVVFDVGGTVITSPWDTSDVAAGDYLVRVTATDLAGNVAVDSVTVTVQADGGGDTGPTPSSGHMRTAIRDAAVGAVNDLFAYSSGIRALAYQKKQLPACMGLYGDEEIETLSMSADGKIYQRTVELIMRLTMYFADDPDDPTNVNGIDDDMNTLIALTEQRIAALGDFGGTLHNVSLRRITAAVADDEGLQPMLSRDLVFEVVYITADNDPETPL